MNSIERYNKHLLLKGFTSKHQHKLSQSKILIIGCGGLGSPAAFYLAAAGVGQIGLVDSDRVELSNLQRQILHATKDIGHKKVFSAKKSLLALNPDIDVRVYYKRLTSSNIGPLIDAYDFIIDATDNYRTKYLINDSCVQKSRAYSYGGIVAYEGQTMTIQPGISACFRCVFTNSLPEVIEKRDKEKGIFGPVCGVIGSLQAAEAIKYICGIGNVLINQLYTFDLRTMDFRFHSVYRNKHCPVCK